MEASRALVILACTSAGISMLALVVGLFHLAQNQSRATAVRSAASGGSALTHLVRTGVPVLFPLAKRMLRIPKVNQLCTRCTTLIQRSGMSTRPISLASLGCAVALVCIGIGCLQGSPLAGVLFAAVVGVALNAWVSSKEDREHERMRDDLPDALRAMSSCFHAGLTLPQTFQALVTETSGPLQRVFAQASHAMSTGRTAQEVLGRMRTDAGIGELSFVAVALEVQHESGGSMQHVLDATSDMLKSELELRRSLKVQTAQARLSARVVVAVTLGLVAVLMTLTEDFLGPFFASPVGLVLLGMAVGMQVLGIVIVRRMLDIETT